MDTYRRRVVDSELDDLFPVLPALSLDGPKGVGKTATASRRAGTVLPLDDPATAEAFEASAQPLAVLPAGTVVIDEWQRVPRSWDLVRRAVDEGAAPGRFLLTGSAVPRGARIHSGAGRIVGLRMRPLSLAERDLGPPTVSMRALLRSGRGEDGVMTTLPDIVGHTDVNLADYVREIAGSGFPGIRPLAERARRAQLDGYVERIVSREFAELGVRVRRPETLRGWLRAYAAATSSTAAYSTILDAATPGQTDKPAKETTMIYRDVLEQLWLLDQVPAWLPVGREFARLGAAPKHFLADPALACRLLDLSEQDLIGGHGAIPLGPQEGTMLGRLFEALVALSLQVYAQANEARVGHFRTRNGDHEVDFIVEQGPRRLLAVEVKLARTVSDADVKHLLWLKHQLGDDLVDMVVITTGDTAYRRRDGVAVVPAALLGP